MVALVENGVARESVYGTLENAQAQGHGIETGLVKRIKLEYGLELGRCKLSGMWKGRVLGASIEVPSEKHLAVIAPRYVDLDPVVLQSRRVLSRWPPDALFHAVADSPELRRGRLFVTLVLVRN